MLATTHVRIMLVAIVCFAAAAGCPSGEPPGEPGKDRPEVTGSEEDVSDAVGLDFAANQPPPEGTRSTASPGATSPPVRYSGMCDASAAAPLTGGLFIAGDDEQNSFHVYRAANHGDGPGRPVASFPWDKPLQIGPDEKHPEVDVEGATVLDGRIYWISSHGRNKDGKWRAARHRFFAMTVTVAESPDNQADGTRSVPATKEITAKPVGEPRRDLIRRLVRDPKLAGLGLAEALDENDGKDKDLAPKREGLNVEGLCVAADGKSLWIGFRNPVPDGKALLVPLRNPAEVLDGYEPRFGPPIRLPLRVRWRGKVYSLGIRGIEYSRRHEAYLILAGPPGKEDVFAVFRWSGDGSERPGLLRQATTTILALKDFTPEALIVYPGREPVQVLSDDGSLDVEVGSPAECEEGEYEAGYCEMKHLIDDRKKTFRSLWLPVE